MGLQIEYAVTADGVRLATLALGEGKPLLIAAAGAVIAAIGVVRLRRSAA